MADMMTRDLDTNEDDGDEQLTQFESNYPEPGTGERPQFSPVATPAMADNIHWGTVRTGPGQPDNRPAGDRAAVAPGMFRRLHEETIRERGGGGGKRRRRKRQ